MGGESSWIQLTAIVSLTLTLSLSLLNVDRYGNVVDVTGRSAVGTPRTAAINKEDMIIRCVYFLSS